MSDLHGRRFEQIYDEHSPRLRVYLRAWTEEGFVEDALARTFEIAWRRIGEVPDDALSWLCGVARNVVSEERRAESRRGALAREIAAVTSYAAGDHAESLIDWEVAHATLARLTHQQREALLLVAEGSSHSEAAVTLGCSKGAIAARIHRARKQIQAMADYGPVPRKPLRSLNPRR